LENHNYPIPKTWPPSCSSTFYILKWWPWYILCCHTSNNRDSTFYKQQLVDTRAGITYYEPPSVTPGEVSIRTTIRSINTRLATPLATSHNPWLPNQVETFHTSHKSYTHTGYQYHQATSCDHHVFYPPFLATNQEMSFWATTQAMFQQAPYLSHHPESCRPLTKPYEQALCPLLFRLALPKRCKAKISCKSLDGSLLSLGAKRPINPCFCKYRLAEPTPPPNAPCSNGSLFLKPSPNGLPPCHKVHTNSMKLLIYALQNKILTLNTHMYISNI